MVLATAVFAMTSCCEDIDSNPNYKEPGENALVLNVPAQSENVIDLEHTDNILLTTSQPDYGFTAATNYRVQVSLNSEFQNNEDGTKNYTELTEVFNSAQLNVKGNDFSSAVNELYAAANGESAELPSQLDVYVRLAANIAGTTNLGNCISNVVKLTVKPYTPPVTVSRPTQMYLVGAMAASNWSTWLPLHPVFQTEGAFYAMIYFDSNCNFKLGPDEGEWGTARTFDQVNYVDNAGAGIVAGDDNGNSKVTKAGWYAVLISTKIKNDEVLYTVTFEKPRIYLFGKASVGGETWDYSDANEFTIPETADGEFVSPVIATGDELRLAFRFTDCQWWTTEFTINDGTLYYRNENILDSWTEKGDSYAVTGATGKRVHINFTTGTASVK